MGINEKTLTLEQVPWGPGPQAAIEETPCPDRGMVSVAWFKDQVESGDLTAFEVSLSGGEVAGYAFARIERGDAGSEFVMVAACGGAQGVDLTRLLYPVFERMAVEQGCVSFRVQTVRRGLGRKLARLGFIASEIVFRKDLASVSI